MAGDFFYQGMSAGQIPTGPLPGFMKPNAAIRHAFRYRTTVTGLKQAFIIHMMIAHIQAAIFICQRDQLTE
jgi:hypothetical protein